MPPSPQDLLKIVQGGASSPLFSDSPAPSPDELLTKVQADTPAPSFGANLLSTAGSFLKSVAGKVGGFYKSETQNLQDLGAGTLKVTPSDVLEGVKKTASGIGTGIGSLAQGFNEGILRIGKSLQQPFTEAAPSIFVSSRENSPLAESISGVKSIPTYQDIYDRAHGYAIDNNATPDQAKTFGGLAVIGMLFADNPITGGEAGRAKNLFKLSEGAVKDLAGTTEEDAIKSILKRENPALDEKQLEALTPVFRNATNDAEVKAAADEIAKIQRVPIKEMAQTEETPNPDQVFRRSQQNFELPKPAEIPESPLPFFRATNEGDFTRFLPVEGQPVKLIDGLDTFLHKPENGAYEVMEASTGRMIGTPGATAEEAVQNAKAALQGRTLEDVQMAIQKFEPTPRHVPTPAEPPLAIPRPFSPNLVRSIAEADLPGPIIDTLKAEFPALSEHAITPIAKRLAKLHRTGDIEGILQVVRNISDDITKARTGGRGPIQITRDTIDSSIAKVSERQAVGDLPASIGELLTAAERGKYLDNVSRVIKDKETAILAQQEYDALWEHADQRVIDRYEELKTERDIVREILSEHPGSQLNNLYKGTFKSPKDVPLDELIHAKKGTRTDTRIDEILGRTGVDIEEAQAELDAFYQMRTQLLEIEKDIREIRPKARAARILQTMVEDVPVITRQYAGDIASLARPEDIGVYKDITGFMGQARDLTRNFERFFGPRYADVKRILLDPFDKSKGNLVDELNRMADGLEENVVKKFNIQRGSKADAAIQRYGDTSLPGGERLSLDGLIAEFGSKRAQDIVEADAWFRGQYDQLIARVNEVRAKIYPNNPDKLIPKRKDYYRHYKELSTGVKDLMDLLEINADSVFPHEIHPTLSGISEFTKPSTKWLSFAQTRTGKGTDISAIGGFLDYAPAFAYAVHIDPYIGNFRYLRRELADIAPIAEPLKLGENRRNTEELIGNFLSYLDKFANDLAGKTNPMDRYIQDTIPGGRKTFAVINWINSRTKANVILGNLSSAIAQLGNVPNGIASAKLYSLPGISRTLASITKENEAMLASSFIKERYQTDLKSRFKLDWAEHPFIGTSDRAKDMAVWITSALDELGTKFIWNSHYEMAKDLIGKSVNGEFKLNGVPYTDAVKFADDITRKMVAGRGIGEKALVQKSKIFQLVAPFQVEVGNAWFVLGDFVKRKEFGAIATLLLANYLFNRAAEEVRGSPVLFDPINALMDGYTQAADEYRDDGTPGRIAFKFVGRQAGEILSNTPSGQTFAAAVPDSLLAYAGITGGKKELYGTADPGRFGTGILAATSYTDPLFKLIPPFGGAQVKRTIEGIQSMVQGEVKDNKGQLSFTTTPTFRNIVQATLFGKNSTAEAQAFYETRDDLFQRKYVYDAARNDQSIEAEKIWAEVKALPREEAIAKMQALEASNPGLSDAVGNVAESEAAGLDGNDRLIKMFGVENGERAKYIVESVNDLKSVEEKAKFLQNLDDKGLIPDQVFEQVAAMMKLKGVPSSVPEGRHSTSGILDTVITYADAIGTDPVTAFNRIFTGQTIRRVDNGTIIVERMSLDASQAERAAQAGANGMNGMNLDHTIPLQLGGSNAKSNLKLVPEATWASYTPVENMLGDALRAKRISKKQAQDLIVQFKEGKLTAEEVGAQVGQ